MIHQFAETNFAPEFGGTLDLFFTNSKPDLCPVFSCTWCSGTPTNTMIGAGPSWTLSGD